uniref:Uncharacterized protein n=1 Tax=Aegilops tauschii subsp. strangulata TaxID=200361 RepID=A0A453LHA0_AEGTS
RKKGRLAGRHALGSTSLLAAAVPIRRTDRPENPSPSRRRRRRRRKILNPHAPPLSPTSPAAAPAMAFTARMKDLMRKYGKVAL